MVTITNSGNVTIKVTNLLNSNFTEDTVNSTTDVRPNCDWLASSEGGHTTGQTTQILLPDTPYKIEFIEGTQTKASLLYFQCLISSNHSDYTFMCPNTSGGSGKNDVFIDYAIGGDIDVFPDFLYDTHSLNYYYGDNSWVIPYDQYGEKPTSSSRADYFLATQFPSSYKTGPYTLFRDTKIRSGRTWEINDVEAQFKPGKKFDVYGNLNSDGATFSAATNWKGMYFASGSDGTLENVDILDVGGPYGGNAAVKIYNADPYFDNVDIVVDVSGGMYGLSLTGSNKTVYFENDGNIKNITNSSVYVSGSYNNVFLYNSNIIQNSNQIAIQASNSGGVHFWPGATSPYVGYDKVKVGRLYASGSGIVNAGTSSSDKSKNHFCDSNITSTTYKYLTTASGGTIYAKHNYWYNGNTPTQSGSNIFYSNNLGSSNCNDVPYTMERKGSDSPVFLASTHTDFQQEEAQSNDLEDLLFQAKKLASDGLYDAAVAILETIIDSREMPFAHVALLELGAVFGQTKISSIRSKLESVIQSDKALEATAMKLLGAAHLLDDNKQLAVDSFEGIVEAYPNTSDAFYAQLSLVDVYMQLGDFLSAGRILDEAIPSDENETYEFLSLEQIYFLEAKAREISVTRTSRQDELLNMTFDEDEGITNQPSSIELNNYPNPFNPSTVISFTLQEEDHVWLAVYDLLGREIQVLVNEVRDKGNYQVSFDAQELPSGTYIYRFTTSAGSIAKTMSVVK